MNDSPSVLKAFALLNKNKSTTEVSKNSSTNVLPTAKSRKALDVLINSTPQDIEQLNLRELLQDLFNWNGGNKVNKPLIRAFKDNISMPYRYPQTVEFTGYMAALSPFLEADNIAHMFDVIKDTKTAFAPTLYTIAFHSNISRAFKDLSTTRIEKIALSLWNESHNGRWWNMTAGIENVQQNQGTKKPETILKELIKYSKDGTCNFENLIWSEENQDNFQNHMRTKLDKNIAILAEKFRKDLMLGIPVTPDIAIFLSSIDWLSPNQRPESPINSLVKTLVNIRENDKSFRMPKKPNTINDLFPSLSMMYKGDETFDFPFDNSIVQSVINKEFVKNIKNVEELTLITSKNALAQNAKHMGNCTLSYQRNMEKGQYALLYLKDDKGEYNASIILNNKKWRIGEINSRYNRGQVPQEIRKIITDKVNSLPPVSEQYFEFIKQFDERNKSYTYSYVL